LDWSREKVCNRKRREKKEERIDGDPGMEEGNNAGSWADVCWGIASEHFYGTGRDVPSVEFGQSESYAEGDV